MTVLSGHTSQETAFLVPSYPYGFTLRCQIRYWIETTKHGQRVVSQTTNPKRAGEVWNKPKASTYSNLRVLYIDDSNGHVENDGLTFYATAPAIDAFVATYGAALTSERDQKELRLLRAVAARQERSAAPQSSFDVSVNGRPVAVVSREVAEAFGMTNLPNVIIT